MVRDGPRHSFISMVAMGHRGWHLSKLVVYYKVKEDKVA